MSTRSFTSLVAILAVSATASQRAVAGGSLADTSFTFQGKVAFDGIDLNDTADFEFTLWDDLGGDNQIGSVQAVNNVDVIDGLFTAELDFGAAAFDGGPRFVEMAIRSPAGVGVFTTLDPRQPITATPYAVHAGSTSELVLPAALEAEFSGVALSVTNSHPTTAVGIEGVSGNNNNGAAGVHGIATGGSATTKGVWGTANSPNGFGGFFEGKGYFSGNVGIGTQTPGKALDINGGGLSVYDDAAQGIHLTTDNFSLASADNEDPVYEYNFGADRHTFYTQGSQRLTITTDGDVGIGTTTPDANLHVRPFGGVASEILVDKAGGALLSLKANVSTASIGTQNDQDLRFVANGSTRMHIGSDGNVGIGTINPNNKLTVFGDANVTGNLGLGVTSPAYRLDAMSSDERVVSVLNTATDGFSYGGYFEATDGSSVGVHGESPNIGVSGNGSSTFGIGIFGTGGIAGVFGNGTGVNGRGGEFYGTGANSTGVSAQGIARGVRGFATGVDSIGVYGASSSDSSFAYGVLGELTDPDAVGVGVLGRAPSYGVTGETTNGLGVGVIGRADGGIGMHGSATTEGGVGVMGVNTSNSGLTYGVYGISNSSLGYGGYFQGRGHFSGNLGVGVDPPIYRFDVHQNSAVLNIAHIERDADANSGSDLLELVMGVGSDATSQFIECEKSGDVEFRVYADGDVTADGIFSPGGADYAEMVRVTSGADSVEPGDVMVIDPAARRGFVKSQSARSKLVAGIYSTAPGVLGSEHDWDQVASELSVGINPENPDEGSSAKPVEVGRLIDEVPLAVVGIVPCKVSAENGAIVAGDLLVTSNTAGHAMRDNDAPNGTIVGKALEGLEAGTGVIRVLVTLQ